MLGFSVNLPHSEQALNERLAIYVAHLFLYELKRIGGKNFFQQFELMSTQTHVLD